MMESVKLVYSILIMIYFITRVFVTTLIRAILVYIMRSIDPVKFSSTISEMSTESYSVFSYLAA